MSLRSVISMEEIAKRKVSGDKIILILKSGGEISVDLKDWNINMLDAKISMT